MHAIAESPEIVTATAHPLGFVHALLWENADGSRLRLHLWPRRPFEPQLPAWPVHRHAWPLTSLVVRGRIRDSRYAIADDPAGDRRLYATEYEDDRSVLRPISRVVRCDVLSQSLWTEGSAYEVPTDGFHSSEAESPSVTIVQSGVPSGRRACVVGVPLDGNMVTYERRRLHSSEIERVLAEVITGEPPRRT
jgi:hypothetical protein